MRRLPLSFLLLLAACSGGAEKTDSGSGGTDGGTDGTDGTDGGTDGGDPVAEGCDPTAPSLCGLPFPSTFYMTEDASTTTGWRIALPDAALPINSNGMQPTGQFLNERDGWSVGTPMMAHFESLSVANLVGHDRIGDSLLDDSATIVIDLDTGERVAHWAERDIAIEDGDRSLLMIHPAAPLAYGHHYVVGLRNLEATDGSAIAPSDAWSALRDGNLPDGMDEARKAHYNDVVFPALSAQGWDPTETTLAWDFYTGSRQQITGRAVHVRDLAIAALPPDGPTYTITTIEEAPNEHTAFRVKGTLEVPLFTDVDDSGAILTRDENGMPYINGTTTVPFTVIIPNILVNEARPGPVVQYGHGLLGDQGEVHGGYLAEMADRYGYVLFAVDWTGMKTGDVDAITLTLVQDLGRLAIIPERTHQGFAEFLYAMRLVTGPLVNDPALQVTDPGSGETRSLIDPTRRYYYGNSQGAILGGAYAAISPDFERAVLGVGGGPYQLLLTRSHDFEPFFQIFKTMYPDPAHISLWLAYIQTFWDEGESTGYATTVNGDPLDGTPEKTILHQVAIGDAQVTTLGAEFLARGHGASLIGSPIREVWGLDTVESTTGSALVEWDYGLSEPYENLPPSADTDPHELPRREFDGQEQLHHFFETGEIRDFCDGPCQDLTRF